jgi:hypothetical protein
MKTKLLSFLAIVLLMAQPAIAGSSLEGGEKHLKKEVTVPSAQAQLGELGPDASLEPTDIASMPVATPATPMTSLAVAEDVASTHTKVAEPTQRKFKPFKVLRELRHHEGGSAVFGILALVFGIVGFALGWIFLFGGLFLAIGAIVFGAIGMSGGRPGKGMAVAGLILGILTIILPILILGLILAIWL